MTKLHPSLKLSPAKRSNRVFTCYPIFVESHMSFYPLLSKVKFCRPRHGGRWAFYALHINRHMAILESPSLTKETSHSFSNFEK
ncbi:hypothetical protein EUGRSUZ_F04001 [Eucalyptus grandis]|uniref:Uncharacterized protein n=2 Tax=Eucalyptus grandis TaxID=71139 RepID=A0A059BY48_EUCGR|nr:hypothetical protein EUGRSUZ_F04001 [Eucalyptus grandis]